MRVTFCNVFFAMSYPEDATLLDIKCHDPPVNLSLRGV